MVLQLFSKLVLLTTYKHNVTSLLADHFDLYDPIALAHAVEDPILADAHLPFTCPIRTKPLSVARLHVLLVDELLVDAIEDGLALSLPERRYIVQSRRCELVPKIRHNGTSLAHVAAHGAGYPERARSAAGERATRARRTAEA